MTTSEQQRPTMQTSCMDASLYEIAELDRDHWIILGIDLSLWQGEPSVEVHALDRRARKIETSNNIDTWPRPTERSQFAARDAQSALSPLRKATMATDHRLTRTAVAKICHNGHRPQGNQWVQIADLVAYVAYQSLLRAPVKKFAWNWFSNHLSSSDRAGAPQPL